MKLKRLNISLMNKSNIIVFIGVTLILAMLYIIAQLSNKALEFASNINSIKSDQGEIIETIRLESINDIQYRMGQEIYIPAYSTLKSGNNEEIDFSITLSVRNTDQTDKFGGSGANFYVVWVSDTLVTEPVVEAIMLGSGLHAYSWVSSGKVVKSK